MAAGAQRRVAVVLFNLGGPDNLDAVRPFLFNLFSDPAIIGLPALARIPLAALIAGVRNHSARANYGRMGGASPLVAETQAQSAALETALRGLLPDTTIETFIAMRYWNPLSAEAAAAVADFAPDEIVLLPLYPQFSTTTTASSIEAWKNVYRGPGQSRSVCCYPTLNGVITAHGRRIEAAWAAAGRPVPARLIFSAHGLPESVVQAGDPYASQVVATAEAVAARLPKALSDWRIAYQSRVGPMKWLGPTTLEEIEAAAKDGVGVVISPIAFVSEHVETLVELDHDYRRRAEAAGLRAYVRAPTLGVEAAFIEGLAGLVVAALGRPSGAEPGSGFTCAAAWSKCPRSSRGKA
jgi:protoporphyrin/coproporphyrin ferrochelatase